MAFAGWLRTKALSIGPRDISFERLGVRCDAERRPGFEQIIDAFCRGYHLTLADDDLGTIFERLRSAVEPDLAGFAQEGIGMGLAILDWFHDRGRHRRCLEIARATGKNEILLVVGTGFAVARMPWTRGGVEGYARRFAPPFDGMFLNGYGFHQGVFRSGGAVEKAPGRDGLSREAARCFDNGLGRAIWFVNGASPERIGAAFERLDASRHEDVWGGLGTACAYGARPCREAADHLPILEALRALARRDEDRAALELGVVFAVALQHRDGHATPAVARASELLLGKKPAEVAALADGAWSEALAAADATKPYAAYRRLTALIMENV